MTDHLPAKSSPAEIAAFVEKLKAMPTVRAQSRGRLLFAIDATASREPTWDQACRIQAEMFEETKRLGGLEIQLAYYRGFGEFETTPWLTNAAELTRRMTGVSCLGGETQIEKVLRHAIAEARQRKINAVVFIGDCMEEDIDRLCQGAGELGLLGVPVFVFHEGGDIIAERAFKQIARLTNGAYCRFDSKSAGALADLLRAVAVFAAGGRSALSELTRVSKAASSMVLQLRGPGGQHE